MKIVVSPLAAVDLQQAYDHIAKDSPEAADRVIAELAETFGLLASGIVKGPEIVLKTGEHVQSWARPPYRIYYRVRKDELQVVRVYHQAREPIE